MARDYYNKSFLALYLCTSMLDRRIVAHSLQVIGWNFTRVGEVELPLPPHFRNAPEEFVRMLEAYDTMVSQVKIDGQRVIVTKNYFTHTDYLIKDIILNDINQAVIHVCFTKEADEVRGDISKSVGHYGQGLFSTESILPIVLEELNESGYQVVQTGCEWGVNFQISFAGPSTNESQQTETKTN